MRRPENPQVPCAARRPSSAPPQLTQCPRFTMELDIGRDAAHDDRANQWADWTWSDEEQQAWNATFHVDYEALGLDPFSVMHLSRDVFQFSLNHLLKFLYNVLLKHSFLNTSFGLLWTQISPTPI